MPEVKKVNLNLVGLDSNCFSLLGEFKNQARKEGWTPEEVTAVVDEAMSGDYNHLVSVLNSHCEPIPPMEDPNFGDDYGEDFCEECGMYQSECSCE